MGKQPSCYRVSDRETREIGVGTERVSEAGKPDAGHGVPVLADADEDSNSPYDESATARQITEVEVALSVR